METKTTHLNDQQSGPHTRTHKSTLTAERYAKSELYYARLMLCGLDWGDIVNALRDAKRLDVPAEWTEWLEQWTAMARKQEAAGSEAAEKNRPVTARHRLLKASACSHFAEFMYYDDVPLKQKMRKEATRLFLRAVPYLPYRVEPVSIPNGGDLPWPGYLIHAGHARHDVDARRPAVILINGLDSAAEVELHAFAREFVERGVSVLLFDGPGQGLLAGKVAMPLQFEGVFESVLGFLQRQPSIDPDHLGVFGVSFGGYLAARVAAYYPRELKACVNLSGAYDLDNFDKLKAPVQRGLAYVFGARNTEEMSQLARTELNLRGVPRLAVPLLTIHGMEDGVFPYDSCMRLMEWAQGEKELISYEGERHVCTNFFSDFIPRFSDWMVEKIAVTR